MKFCVIDIGSNSVRLMLSNGKETVYKKVKMTRLAENLGKERFLCSEAIKRTSNAVYEFYLNAKEENPDEIYIFATAAVRNSINGKDFCSEVKKLTGLDVDVVSGEVEAMLGIKGALRGKKAGIIDIGGASTEVAYVSDFNPYSNSFNIGAGTLTDKMKEKDVDIILDEVFSSSLADLGKEFYCIGGTATSVVATLLELEVYNPKMVDGYKLKREEVAFFKDKLSKMKVEEIALLKGLQKGRERVIYAGVCILNYLMEKLSLPFITVSESDNLEGYLEYIRSENEKKI